MSSDSIQTDPYSAVQPSNDVEIEDAVDSIVEDYIQERIEEANQKIGTFVR